MYSTVARARTPLPVAETARSIAADRTTSVRARPRAVVLQLVFRRLCPSLAAILLCACGRVSYETPDAVAGSSDAAVAGMSETSVPVEDAAADAPADAPDGADALVEPPPSDAGPEPSDVANLVFVTSLSWQPYTFGGLSGADARCAELAAAAGLSGTYVAWLSSPTVDAVTRLGSARGWVRPDGRPVVDTVADLVAGRLFYPIGVTEEGVEIATRSTVVTATNAEGMLSSGLGGGNAVTCADWTLDTGDYTGGDPVGTTSDWTRGWINDCRVAARLYCFQIDHASPVSPEAVTGRRAFLSSPFSPGGGLAAADATCAADASAAGLAGTYRALLASGGTAAASRFDGTGLPWVRLDGVPLAETAAELLSGAVDTTLNVRADASYVADWVWTGAASPGEPGTPASTCSDWTNGTGGATGTRGRSSETTSFFEAVGSPACNASYSVYCLEE